MLVIFREVIKFLLSLGLPNGFGVHVAYSKERIIAVFPPPYNNEGRIDS